MNFGISIKNGPDRELSPAYLEFYKKNGITHLEISILDCGEGSVFFSEGFQSRVRTLSNDFTISCHALMWPNLVHPVKRTRAEALRLLEKMLGLCDAIGAMWLTVHMGANIGPRRYAWRKLDRFARELNALYDMHGWLTPVCIENMPVMPDKKLTGESFSELERVLVQTDRSRCGLLFDIGHYFLMYDSKRSDGNALARTLGVHIHNNSGLRDDHNYIYDGVHDPARILKEVAAAAPGAKLIFENYRMDFDSIIKSIAYINQILNAAPAG